MDNNILIADFMGWKYGEDFTPDPRWKNQWCTPDGIRHDILFFNSEWDWLMPVIIKICDNNHWSIEDLTKSLSSNYGLDNFLILDDTYMAVVKYIEDN